ncbi:MAG TPA: PAS domain-containing protein [Acetobacteraceae bacterium]|nr:PAS domain-containing protein [Acetobacteraceae bacterium]
MDAVELPIAEMPNTLERALAYWIEKKSSRLMPSRADIDPIEFKDYLGRVALVNVQEAAPRFKLRLIGSSHFFRKHGPRDGHDIMEVKPKEYALEVARQYEETVARREPTVFRTTLAFHGTAFSYTRLALPLGTDGNSPDMLLAVAMFKTDEQRDFFSRYEDELESLAG